MKHIFVRPARQSEGQLFLDWSLANQENSQFDPKVPKYPSTVTFCAFDEQGPLAFLPAQQPLMLESLAPRPGADPSDIARALKEITQECVSQAYVKGVGEIYFLATEGTIEKFVEKQEVFQKLPYVVYRLKLSDLEPQE